MTDGRLMRSMLLDFYGELLTERQRECYDLHYNDDLSLSETQDALTAAAERLKELCGMTDGDARTLAQSALEDIEALREKR